MARELKIILERSERWLVADVGPIRIALSRAEDVEMAVTRKRGCAKRRRNLFFYIERHKILPAENVSGVVVPVL